MKTPSRDSVALDPKVTDALLAAACEWIKSGIILKSTFWKTDNVVARCVEDVGRSNGS